MKFQIILICALVAFALAKKDKVKDKKDAEVKVEEEKEKEDKPKDDDSKESYFILTPPGKEHIEKESVMDWESSYGSYPAGLEVLRRVGPSVYPLRDVYPGLGYPTWLHPQVIPYAVRRAWNPEDYYNHFGSYPVAK